MRCAPTRSHIRILLPYFIKCSVQLAIKCGVRQLGVFALFWKARNAFRFDSQTFSMDGIIHQVRLDLRFASSTFGFKPSQLWGALGYWITEDLHVIILSKRLIRLVSWM